MGTSEIPRLGVNDMAAIGGQRTPNPDRAAEEARIAHPLSFLLLVGMSLVADGFGQHISKGYIYFAMGFSVFVEMLNLKIRARGADPVKLRRSIEMPE
jgi:hypothetical protein